MDVLARHAREASHELAVTSLHFRNAVLLELARLLQAEKAAVLTANQRDLEEAVAHGVGSALYKVSGKHNRRGRQRGQSSSKGRGGAGLALRGNGKCHDSLVLLRFSVSAAPGAGRCQAARAHSGSA